MGRRIKEEPIVHRERIAAAAEKLFKEQDTVKVTVSDIAKVGRAYLRRTGKGSGAFNCPGPACGSAGGHVLLITISNRFSYNQ